MTKISLYSSSVVSQKMKLGRNALRLYEEMGLLSSVQRSITGYRQYSEINLEELNFIIQAKSVGFSLIDIRELLKISRQSELSCREVSLRIADKHKQLKKEIKTLQNKVLFLNQFLKTCEKQTETTHCQIITAGFVKEACCNN